jgi:hypothetical protein
VKRHTIHIFLLIIVIVSCIGLVTMNFASESSFASPYSLDEEPLVVPSIPTTNLIEENEAEERNDIQKNLYQDAYDSGQYEGQIAGTAQALDDKVRNNGSTPEAPDEAAKKRMYEVGVPQMDEKRLAVYRHGFMQGFRDGWKYGYQQGLSLDYRVVDYADRS